MSGALTNAGRNLAAVKQGAGQPLIINRFLFASVPSIDGSSTPSLNESTPPVNQQVGTFDVDRAAYVSADKVVYSVYLGTSIGDFSYNWVGLLADDDTLVAVQHIDTVPKRATVGPILGDSHSRNFLLTFIDAQAITNISITAATWQLQFDVATETQAGLAEIATQAETDNGTDDSRYITPVKLASRLLNFVRNATTTVKGMIELATQAEMDAGSDDTRAATPKKIRNGFAASTATNGYVKLPSWLSGITLQWGYHGSPSGLVVFPLEFTTSCFNVQLTANGGNDDDNMYLHPNTITKAQFSAYGGGTLSGFYWLAVGY